LDYTREGFLVELYDLAEHFFPVGSWPGRTDLASADSFHLENQYDNQFEENVRTLTAEKW